jgi:hypothetical protein
MVTKIEELHERVEKIEKQKSQEVFTLVEILSNFAFFGELKKANCEYSKNGQCSFFILESEAGNKIPIALECRITECKEPSFHCHLEISNISCTLCQKTTNLQKKHWSEHASRKPKGTPKNKEKLSLNEKNKNRGKEK